MEDWKRKVPSSQKSMGSQAKNSILGTSRKQERENLVRNWKHTKQVWREHSKLKRPTEAACRRVTALFYSTISLHFVVTALHLSRVCTYRDSLFLPPSIHLKLGITGWASIGAVKQAYALISKAPKPSLTRTNSVDLLSTNKSNETKKTRHKDQSNDHFKHICHTLVKYISFNAQ